jgi:hypothetical protein
MSLFWGSTLFNGKVQAASWLLLLNKYEGDEIKTGNMNGACNIHGRDMHTGGWLENLKKQPLGRQKSRWKDDIKMDFMETEWVDIRCIHLD